MVYRSAVYFDTPSGTGGGSADNPAMAAYYLLNRAGEGVAASRIDYQAFVDWSTRCQERGYKVNLYIDSTGSLRRALDMVSLNGRASVVQMGSKFTCLVDLPEGTPVQRFLFTMGNIAADSFTEEWMPVGDRANAVEVTYFDAELDYTRQTVEIYSSDFDTSPMEINKVSVTLWGCTDKGLATKYGKFLLYCNRYLTLTSSWNADVDAIACIPNDIIDAAHDVPQWGQSGRIVGYTSTPPNYTFTLDRLVHLAGFTAYEVHIRRINDDSYDVFTFTSTGETDTSAVTCILARSTGGIGSGGLGSDGAIVDSTVDGALVDSTADGAVVGTVSLPEYAGSVYSLGIVTNVVKPMRVMRISRASDMRKKLTCLEYASEVYVDGVTY
jgi:hypothetical protein